MFEKILRTVVMMVDIPKAREIFSRCNNFKELSLVLSALGYEVPIDFEQWGQSTPPVVKCSGCLLDVNTNCVCPKEDS